MLNTIYRENKKKKEEKISLTPDLRAHTHTHSHILCGEAIAEEERVRRGGWRSGTGKKMAASQGLPWLL